MDPHSTRRAGICLFANLGSLGTPQRGRGPAGRHQGVGRASEPRLGVQWLRGRREHWSLSRGSSRALWPLTRASGPHTFLSSCFVSPRACVSLAARLPSCVLSCRPHSCGGVGVQTPSGCRASWQRVKDTPESPGKGGLGGGLGLGATCGFTVSTSPSSGIVGSANALRGAFCLCPANPAENSEHVVLSPVTSVQGPPELQGSMEPGLPPEWT